MQKRGVLQWAVVLIVLVVLLYIFFNPTGKVIFDINEGPINLIACGEINTSGDYTIERNLATNSTECFVINAPNTTLNCKGYTIGNESTDSIGIVVNGATGIILTDCILIGNSTVISVKNNGTATLVNVSYASEKESIETGSQIIRKWVVDINVVGQTGNNIGEANVSILKENTSELNGATNSDGKLITILAQGTYNISSTKQGYSIENKEENVAQNLEVKIVLNDTESPVVTHNAVEIEAGIQLDFNVQDNGVIAYCSGIVGTQPYANTSEVDIGSNSITITGLQEETEYDVHVGCVDSAGNNGVSTIDQVTTLKISGEEEEEEEQTTTTEQPQTQPVEILGTGNKYTIAAKDLAAGATTQTGKSDKLIFMINNIRHTLTLDQIANGKAGFVLTSPTATIASFVLSAGQSNQIDIDSNKVYDLLVKLNELKANSASVYVKSISIPIPQEEKNITILDNSTAINETKGLLSRLTGFTGLSIEEIKGKTPVLIGVGVVIILIIAALVFRWLKNRKNQYR